jgi:hypothetical protein
MTFASIFSPSSQLRNTLILEKIGLGRHRRKFWLTCERPSITLEANVNVTVIFEEVRILKSIWLGIILFCNLFPLTMSVLAAELDPSRFMPVDQIQTGMVGVGKTVFSGTRIEEFQVEILGVLKKARPHGDIILARFSGGPLEKAGLIQGMSGSPIYIEGKLIGAQAFGWAFSTEPIGGITPIGEMWDLWQQMESQGGREGGELRAPDYPWELGGPVEEVFFPRDARPDHLQIASRQHPALVPLKTPVMLSGFDDRVVDQMAPIFERYGLMPIQAGTLGEEELDPAPLEPGASLAVQLVRGDVNASAIGTLTYREGDRIMGFGHPLFSAGNVDFPMTAAYVHSILPSQTISFKLASTTKQMGVLRQDRRAGVAGVIGQAPSMIPIQLSIHHSHGEGAESFFFEIIDDQFFSPNLVTWTTLNSLLARSATMGDLTMELDARIAIDGRPDLEVRNIFSGAMPYVVLATELGEIVGVLLRNELEDISLRDFTLDITVQPLRRTAQISSARAAKRTVRPGEDVQVTVFLEPYRGEEQTVSTIIRVPEDAPEGRLALQINDAISSMKWEQKRAPHRFNFQNLDQLLEMLGKLERNDQLIVKLVMARGGAVIKGQELPSLPPSALAVLRGSQQEGEGQMTREMVLVEKRVPTDYVLSGQIALPLVVKR